VGPGSVTGTRVWNEIGGFPSSDAFLVTFRKNVCPERKFPGYELEHQVVPMQCLGGEKRLETLRAEL
jgi:hypothetical protein